MRLSSFVSPREFGFVRAFFFAFALALLSAFCTQAQTKPIYQRDYIYDSQGRLINTVEPDTYGPFAPTGVSAAFDDTVCAVDVDWNATTDLGGSGVAKYWIYRNSTYVGQTTGLSYVDNYSIRLDLLPSIRREVYMILRNEEECHVEGKAQRSGDDRGVEAIGSGAAG
jgi:hypothetical protein